MDKPEFSRVFDTRSIDAQSHRLEADETERAALAARFAIVAINSLEAEISLERDGPSVDVTGELSADIVQSCAISGEDLPVTIRERLVLRFVPESNVPIVPDEEVELEEGELDEVPFSGTSFDVGEAIAQSLALAIDPYAAGPNAEAARQKAGLLDEESAGAFAALAALKGKAEE